MPLVVSLLGLFFLFAQSSDFDPAYVEIDKDQDLFSPSFNADRGAKWRGRDCDDSDALTYPGKISIDKTHDQNCNGVAGWSNAESRSYEELYCHGSGERGVVIFGDSISAFASVKLGSPYLSSLAQIFANSGAENSIVTNFPERSWATGFSPKIGEDSIYLRMRKRNLCNHGDYQNLAYNGAGIGALAGQVARMARTPKDKPILAFISFSGNDVCRNLHDAESFKLKLREGLTLLDQKAPPNSKILMIGLAKVSRFWNLLKDRPYPGWFFNTYEDLWTTHPLVRRMCPNWYTQDLVQLERTREHVRKLNSVLKGETLRASYKNFDLGYIDFPMEIFDETKSTGYEPGTLIDPTDGFHLSGLGQTYLSRKVWDILITNYPDFIGEENPNNSQIKLIQERVPSFVIEQHYIYESQKF